MGVTVDFAPSKLKQGYGEQAIFVLDRLSDEALRASQFQWFKPSGILEEGGDDEEDVEDEAELNLDKVEEEMAAEYSDEEDEDDILHINGEKTNLEFRPNHRSDYSFWDPRYRTINYEKFRINLNHG